MDIFLRKLNFKRNLKIKFNFGTKTQSLKSKYSTLTNLASLLILKIFILFFPKKYLKLEFVK